METSQVYKENNHLITENGNNNVNFNYKTKEFDVNKKNDDNYTVEIPNSGRIDISPSVVSNISNSSEMNNDIKTIYIKSNIKKNSLNLKK